MILGIIPARAGSKRIKNKNLYPLNGKPLIEYTIEAAEQSNLDDYIITTDDTTILQYNKAILRPTELCQDDTPMLPVIQHAVKDKNIKAIMVLQPTSPLRTTEDINKSLELYHSVNNECLISACKGIHPKKSYDINYRPFYEQTPYDKHIDKCYTRNGAIFITSKNLLDKGKLFDNSPFLYLMPKHRSIDIDDYEDLKIAEALVRCNYD